MLIGTISPEGSVPAKPGVIYWDKLRKIQWVKEEGPTEEPFDADGWNEQYAAGEEV